MIRSQYRNEQKYARRCPARSRVLAILAEVSAGRQYFSDPLPGDITPEIGRPNTQCHSERSEESKELALALKPAFWIPRRAQNDKFHLGTSKPDTITPLDTITAALSCGRWAAVWEKRVA